MDEGIQHAFASDRTIDIITHGRKTGQRRPTEIWFRSTAIKLQQLIAPYGPSKAHLMRRWLVQIKSENFPNCWRNREMGQCAHQSAYTRMGHDSEPHP